MGWDWGKGRGGERREKRNTGESLGEWEGGDGERADIGARKKISTLRIHFRVGKRLGSQGDPRCPRGCPQLGPWTAEERVPELSLPHYHAGDYLEYHHRIFVQQRKEIETEILIRAMD